MLAGMPAELDPYRVLGLARGATVEEIRRAYRRLAKINHPDAAGEAALPRFLAIQAAYETLVGSKRGRPIGTAAGAARSRSRPRSSDGSAAGTTGRRPGARPGGATTGRSESAGTSPGPAAGGGTSRRTGRRRPPNRATPGSTSYDEADEEPFNPEWSGATWYGASSGTYWTINPREYADPRKHGPEYQRRARRAAGGWILDDETTFDPGPAVSETPASAESSESGDSGPAEGRPAPEPRPNARPFGGSSDHPIPNPLRRPAAGSGRLWLALLGWPPLGLAAAGAIGETSGCGRFSAACAEVYAPGTWILQAAIIVLLLAVPRVALWSAHGTIASLAAAVPTAVVLSAAGGSNQPEASSTVLAVVLAVAYVAGVAFAVVRDWQQRSVPSEP
jgi:hypothetical protein